MRFATNTVAKILTDPGDQAYLRALAESDYEGWVAWVDGAPVLEAVAHNSHLAPILPGGIAAPFRAKGRGVMEWAELPKDRVQTVAILFGREMHMQPPLIIDRAPGRADVRFIQYKEAALVMKGSEQHRSGVLAYVLGYWDPRQEHCQLWRIPRHGPKQMLPAVPHPCWPKPYGHGLAPRTVGLKDGEVSSPQFT